MRALVCENRYPYPATGALPQEADAAAWAAFRQRHADPKAISKNIRS